MDRDVTHKILYGPKRSWGTYTILWVTDRSINCHLVRYMQICQRTCFCYCISKTKSEFGQNPEENIILIGPGPYTKILTGQYTKILSASQTKTNRENKNLKYNIQHYYQFMNYYRAMWCCFEIFLFLWHFPLSENITLATFYTMLVSITLKTYLFTLCFCQDVN